MPGNTSWFLPQRNSGPQSEKLGVLHSPGPLAFQERPGLVAEGCQGRAPRESVGTRGKGLCLFLTARCRGQTEALGGKEKGAGEPPPSPPPAHRKAGSD